MSLFRLGSRLSGTAGTSSGMNNVDAIVTRGKALRGVRCIACYAHLYQEILGMLLLTIASHFLATSLD